MSTPMQTYMNPTSETVRIAIGVGPGSPAAETSVAPGETTEGPVAYAKMFKRCGLVPAGEVSAPPPAAPVEPDALLGDAPAAAPSKGKAKGQGKGR